VSHERERPDASTDGWVSLGGVEASPLKSAVAPERMGASRSSEWGGALGRRENPEYQTITPSTPEPEHPVAAQGGHPAERQGAPVRSGAPTEIGARLMRSGARDANLPVHVRKQSFRQNHRTVGLLMVLEERNENPWAGDGRVV